MGAEITALAPDLGFELGPGIAKGQTVADLNANACDAVIDFSLPEATDDVISWCVSMKKPLVSGVTGISEAHRAAFTRAGEKISVLWAPNMSLGVAVLARVLAGLGKLEGFEFQIEELHHSQKKDKPSGTALFLQERLEAAVGRECPDPLAIRGGGIFGIHRIWAMGAEETLTFEHTAMNRRVFARGALKAARWLINQPKGLYSLDDMLGA
jgi:4-hydroxy-tetrahydrodipicolinate reductase